MKIQKRLLVLGLFLVFVATGMAGAQEIELQFIERTVSFNPVFEQGKEGDVTRIVGFDYEVEYLFGEERIKLATETGEARLPEGQFFNPLSQVIEAPATGTLTVPSIGNFSFKGTMIALGGAAAATTGEVIMSFVQSYTDGTGLLAGFYGLGSGTGKVNLFTGGGETQLKMILIAPTGP